MIPSMYGLGTNLTAKYSSSTLTNSHTRSTM
jgi:hypothetical protein